MTHLEMFKKILEKHEQVLTMMDDEGDIRIYRKTIDGWNAIIDFCDTDLAVVIEETLKKCFPPIPEEVGGWVWNGEYWRREGANAHPCGEAGYEFLTSGGAGACVNINGLQGFRRLIDINPDLLPPTQSQGETND